ncbi:MAG: DNA-3-methyladenine glycosylase [Candidatus Nitrosocaldaceae archaeon]
MIIERPFYARDTVKVAQELLGKILVRVISDNILTAMIVETEAYKSFDDPASHSYKGLTKRNKPMFGEVGYSYVYFTYGNHYCFNIVAKDEKSSAGAVLIRAVEPLSGIEIMKKKRGVDDIYKLTSGPGRLTQALSIDKSLNEIDLTRECELYVINGYDIPIDKIESASRIGIRDALDKQWRFYIKDNPFVSR